MRIGALVLLALMAVAPGFGADRYKSFLYGVAYYPEHWPESYWERDARLMQEAGVNAVRMGEFAWYLMEPREGVYDFSLFDRAIAVLAKHGIKTILGTPTAAPPKWLTAKYPEALAVYPDGRPVNDQTRRHYCYNSPAYRRLSKKIVEEMAAHFKNNADVIGWQTDNEFNCHIDECYSESCRRAFREWAKERYGTLESLNERWGNAFWSQSYDNWSELDLPFPAPAYHNPALMLDYKRFLSASVISYQRDQVEIIRRYRPDDFITHNGYFKNIDYYEFSRDLDIFSFDNYPCFHDQPRYPVGARLTFSRGFSDRFMVMEEQTGPGGQAYLLRAPRPGEMSLWAFQAIAHGADGMMHFRWRTARKGAEEYWSGVLEHDNIPRARYDEFKREGSEVHRIEKEVLGSKVVSDIAVLKDYDAEWVFDYQFLTKEVNIGAEYEQFFQAASEARHNIDFIGESADFSRYKVIFAPHLILMDEGLAGKIRRYVERGGTFVMSAHSAVKNRDNAMTDQVKPILVNDLFGVDAIDFQCYQPPSAGKNAIRFADGTLVPVHVFADVLKTKTASPLATWNADFLKSGPAVTVNRVGKGQAVYYGSFFNLESARYLIRHFAAQFGLKPLMTGVPESVEVTRRTRGTTNYYFVLNHEDATVEIKPGPGYFDVLAGAPAPAAMTLKPFEYRVLRK
ncbi:MAG: beta-galactosidase [Acidobacteriota bacterium]